MINVLADKYLYKIADFIPDDINLELFDSNQPLQKIPAETHALLIRTITKINSETFPSFPKNLSFIGTGSAGMDHVDTNYLQQNDINFSNAAGCNARSVGEYVTVALLLWAEEHKIDLSSLTVGIIGAGHTGSEVNNLLTSLRISTITYDPPREERDPDFKTASLDEVLKSDILTFHVPLTHQTAYPTFHWLDEDKLSNRSFSLILNASRGGVVDEQALLEACRSRTVNNYILDVWENEPDFRDEIARHAFIKTPHIAGYSVQAKERASKMIADALADCFSLKIKKEIPSLEATASMQAPLPSFYSLPDVLTYYHPIRDYETRFRMLIGRDSENKIKGFNRIRSNHPLRNEFRQLKIPNKLMDKFPTLKSLLFKNK